MGDSDRLAAVIASEWPDISFGLGQRIVLYHYLGDGTPSLRNVLAVREQVFAHPERDILEAARKVAGAWHQSQDYLLALAAYNCGYLPARDDPYWTRYAANVENYRRALDWARGVIRT